MSAIAPEPEDKSPAVVPPQSGAAADQRPGWSVPQPETLARPTYWPAVLAAGIIFLLWGAVAMPLVSGVGAVLCALALAGWIGELRHERRDHEHHPVE